MYKLCYIDCETTGTDPYKAGIIQLSGIIEINGEVKEEFNYHITPFAMDTIDDKALEITGFKKEELFTDPRFADPRIVHGMVNHLATGVKLCLLLVLARDGTVVVLLLVEDINVRMRVMLLAGWRCCR